MSSEGGGPPEAAGGREPAEAEGGGEPAAGRERRLHPAGILVLALGALREAAIPVVALAVAGVVGGGLDTGSVVRVLALTAIAATGATIAGGIAWFTTTWRVGPATLHHRRGLLSIKETDVPLNRVQAVDTVRGPVQRVFGVVGVHVQTAGGGREGEVILPALGAGDVEALRAAIGARGGERARAGPAGPVRRLGRRRLLVAALTAGQLGVIVPVLAALPQIADDVFDGGVEDVGRTGAGLAPDGAAEWLVLALGVVALAWVLSVIGTLVAFAGFRVARQDDRLRIRRGLLARRDASVPVARVQAVRVVEGLLRRPWGLASLRVEVAGYKAEAAAAQTLFPLLRLSEAQAFLAELLPELADDPRGLTPVPRRSARRYVAPPAALGLAAGAVAAVLVPGAGPWPLLLAVPAAGVGLARHRAAGWRLDGGRLAVRSQRLARVTVLAPAARLQEHGLRQTPLQRRARLADLEVRVGAGTRGRVRHLEAATAAALFEALRRRGAALR